MEIQNKISEQVFDKLRSKFSQITLGNEDGESTQDPNEAVFFNFNYVDNQGHNHGNITISLIDRTMKIYYSKNISSDLSGSELTEWYAFLLDMRKTAMSNIYQFDTHDISKSNLDVADIQSTVKRNNMQENKMYGSKKRSYQDHGPAKIIVRHTENIDPEIRGSRSRKIESVFVETFEGERFKMPFKSLPGTRAMARHIAEGGLPYDDIGESITTMVNEISSLRPFISRNRNAIYEDETTMQMVEAAREYYTETRKSLGKIKGKRGYKAYAESFEVTEKYEYIDEEATAMIERFTNKRFNDKMENAMPVVHKAFSLKNMKPKTPGTPRIKPIQEFEEWVEEVTEMPEVSIIESCSEILSDEEKSIIVQWIDGQIEDLPSDLFEKLFDHYLDNGEMPYGTAKARTGDPYQWMFDRMEQEYGHINETKEEMCSTQCCGHTVSDCHCGPECPHCDCYEKKKLKEGDKSPSRKQKIRYLTNVNIDTVDNLNRLGSQTIDDYYADAKKSVADFKKKNKISKVSKPKKKVNEAGEQLWGVFPKGGSVGGKKDKPWKTSTDKEAMKDYAKRMRKQLSPGEKSYYKMGYVVRPVQTVPVGEGDDKVQRSAKQRKLDRRADTRVGYKKKLRNLLKNKPVNEQQLDENILQSLFGFMWRMAGKIPSIAKKRKTAELTKEFNEFKETMTDDKIDEWLDALSSKLKSTHHNTEKAKTDQLTIIRKVITRVKGSQSEKAFAENMQKLRWELRHFKKFITKSNKGVMDRKRNNFKKSFSDPKNKGDEKLANWVKKGTENINEGTWALPDNPEKKARLKDLMASPLKFGIDGENATSALYDLLGDDSLFDDLYAGSKTLGPEADARQTILDFINSRKEQGWDDADIAMLFTNESISIGEDVILPKATYSDYLEVASKGDVDEMVSALKKKGKKGSEAGAKGALKRMEEQEAKSGLHITESIKKLQREAGIIK